MLFDENELNSMIDFYDCPSCTLILECPICKKKYSQPRTLPCGNVVCSSCVVSVTKSINKHYQFKCSLCAEIHDLPKKGFPICKQFQNMLYPNKDECINNTAEELKKQLREIKKKINDLNKLMENGVEKVVEHCLNVRNEVKRATKNAFQFIKQLSDSMIGQVNSYEKECLASLDKCTFDDSEYKRLISEMNYFTEEWDSYFENVKKTSNYELTDDQLQLAVDAAFDLKKKSGKMEKKHDEYLFNKKIVKFEKNFVKIKKDFLGTIKFKPIGPICYNDLKQINIGNLIHDAIPLTLEISLEVETFYILYQTVTKHLKCITTNREKTLVTSYATNKPIIKFLKYKDTILVNYMGGNGNHYNLQLLNLKLQNLYQIDVHNTLGFNCNYRSHFLAASDYKFYYYSLYSKNRSSCYQLRIFNKQLQFIKSIGQSTNPNEVFYFSFTIRQLEARNGKFFWLDDKDFVIMNESTGIVQKWMTIDADKFLIDSNDEIIILNKETKKLCYFNNDGILINEVAVLEFEIEPIIFLDNNDKVMLYDPSKSLILSLNDQKQ